VFPHNAAHCSIATLGNALLSGTSNGMDWTHVNVPSPVLLEVDRVAEAVVKVVRNGIAPEYSIPRWISPFQVFRVLTPPLYRWGVQRARGRTPPTPSAPPADSSHEDARP